MAELATVSTQGLLFSVANAGGQPVIYITDNPALNQLTLTIANQTGTVKDISLRRTVLRAEDGTVHFVPHGLIQTASNLSRSWAGISVDIPVPYDEDLAAVTAAVNRAGDRLADDPRWAGVVLDKPHVAHVERL